MYFHLSSELRGWWDKRAVSCELNGFSLDIHTLPCQVLNGLFFTTADESTLRKLSLSRESVEEGTRSYCIQ